MKEVILLKNGELALKGLNRRTFEDILVRNALWRLADLGRFRFVPSQSTIMAEPLDEDIDLDEAVDRLTRVFGFAGLSRAAAVEKDMNTILSMTGDYLAKELLAARTFKVNAKRSDKKFPFDSPQICMDLGEVLLESYPHLQVDVRNPELTVTVEIRDKYAFIHGNQIKGAGGMPVSSSGKAALLISGGIDSPVAGWMMAKRGLSLIAVHFASPPYTSPKAEIKVHNLLKKVAAYSGRITLFVVPFTEIQEQIKDNCPEELFTLIMRRMMMKIAEIIALRENCGALITGECVGQVASQTMQSLAVTNAAVDLPVFRPLIGMDKEDVVLLSRKIDTFDISIQPYEDCCTIFTPKHPRTRPKLEYVVKAENMLDIDLLITEAVNGMKIMNIH
ncbi:MAG: tRNA 4-thiouridine(8) synthase ThiI [Clostridiales bacterium]|nr:tRNA 4-thiouridine(8) synthase ThiI [Clostridiales bacterium]